jgi:cullin 1
MYKKKISEMVSMVEKALQTKTGSSNSFLIEYVDQWRKFTIFTNTIRKVMQYLERFYLKSRGDQSLTERALAMYRDKIFHKNLGRLRSAILVEIKKDREGEMVDHGLVKKAIMQFIYVGFKQKVNIAKVKESNELDWIGEQSLHVYDE